MGLVAFGGFVLPWLAIGLWLALTRIKPYHTGVPWRPLTDYVAPGDERRSQSAAPAAPGAVAPIAEPAPLAPPAEPADLTGEPVHDGTVSPPMTPAGDAEAKPRTIAVGRQGSRPRSDLDGA